MWIACDNFLNKEKKSKISKVVERDFGRMRGKFNAFRYVRYPMMMQVDDSIHLG